MAITYFGSKKLMGTKLDRVTDSLGSSADGVNSGVSTEPVHSQSTAGSLSGVDLYQTTGGGGWGMRFNSGHAVVGSKLKKFKVSARINNPSNRSDQNMTCKVYDGTDKSTVRASSNSINTSVLDQGSTFEDVEFTFSSPVVINAGDCVLVSCDNDLGTAGGWNCEIKESADTNGHFVTWVDNGSFTLQTSRCLKYDATLVVVAKLGTSAYKFDGSGDQVIFGSASDWAFLNSGEDFSLAFWCKPTATNATQALFATMNDASGSNKGFSVSMTSANKMNIAVYPSAGGGYPFANDVGTSVFEAGVWHHYALVYTKSDGKMRIYKDGSKIVEQAKGGTFTSGNPQFALMCGQRGDGGDRDYNGKLDDVGVYSRALSTTEIGKLANNNDPPFTHTGDQNSYGTTSIANNSLVLDSNSGSSQTASPVAVRDLGTLGSSWCVRWSVYAPTQSESISGKNSFARFGFSDKGTYSSSEGLNNVTDKAILWNWHLGTSLLKNMTYTGGSGTNNGGQSISYADDTTWYWEMKYDGSTVTITRYNSDYSSAQVTADTISVSGYTGMNYLVIGQPRDHNNGTWELRFDNIKIWNNQSSATGDPDFTFEFDNNTDGGDAQSVSTISNKAGLKAHYTMDSTSKSLPTATLSEDFSSDSAWTLHSSSSISGGKITCTNTGESYRSVTGLGKPASFTWDFTWTRNSGDAGDTSSLILSSQNSGYGDPSSGHTNVQFYMANGNVTTLSVRKNSGSGNVQTECTFGVGSSSVNIQPTGTTRYYRITKNGSVWTMKKFTSASDRTNDTNAEASATATQNSTANSTWDSGSGNLTYLVVDGHASGAKNYSIDDIVIYNGTTTGCQNDASSTSDLEAMTNLLVNSTFLQIDGTPQYYWKQSDNTWEIDGLYVAPAYSYLLGGRVSGANINNITKGLNATDTMTMASSGTITTAQSGLCGCENDDNTNVYLIYHSTNSGYAKNIDKIPTATDTPSVVDVGDMPTVGSDGQGASSTTHGYSYGGNGGGWYRNSIEKFSFSTNGDGTDVGDMTYSGQHMAGAEDKTNGYGYHHGGYNGSGQVGIGRWSFTTDGNASSVGSLATSGTVGFAGGAHNETHVWQFGGRIGNGSWTDDIQKYAFGSSVSCSKIGDMSTTTFGRGGVTDDNDTAWISGGSTNGENTPTSNVVKYAFNVDSAETDIGDLPSATYDCAGCDGK